MNESYNHFFEQCTKVYEQCFPLKTVRGMKNDNPWFTKKLQKMCRKKYSYYKKFLKHPTESSKRIYKEFRYNVTHEIKRAKKNISKANLREQKVT